MQWIWAPRHFLRLTSVRRYGYSYHLAPLRPEKCLVARLWFVVLVFGPVSGAVFRYLFGGAHSEYSRPRTQKVRPKMGAEMGPRSGPKTKVRGPLQNHPTALFAMREQRTSPGQNAHSDFDSELDITG